MVFRTACGRATPVAREEIGVSSWRVISTHAARGRLSRSEIPSSGEGVGCGGYHQFNRIRFISHGFDARDCLFFGLYSSRLRGCCGFRLKLLWRGHLPCGGHLCLLRGLCHQLRIRIRVGVEVAFTTRTSRTTWFFPMLRFLYSAAGLARLAFGAACSAVLLVSYGCLPCKNHLSLFPVYTAPVFRHVVIPAATALRLSIWGQAFTRELRSTTRDALGHISAITLHVSKKLAVLVLQRASWRNIQLHHHSQTSEPGEGSHPQHLRAPCHGNWSEG